MVQSIGDLDLTQLTEDLDDPAFYANIMRLLDQYGLFNQLPQEFRVAIEFLIGVLEYPGGPLNWLEDQWNTIITFGDELVGSFKEIAAGEFSPDSLVSFTQTAINVLTWLASILDFGFLGADHQSPLQPVGNFHASSGTVECDPDHRYRGS